jgi:hypothetical protein
MKKVIIGAVVVGACALFYAGFYFGKNSVAPVPITTIAKSVPPPVAKPTVEKQKEPTLEERLALATGGLGEGEIHPFTRQLIADPTLITDPKEQFAGDRTDKKALKRWAGRQAFLIATKFGYIDWKFGAEIRIRRPGETAFLLSKDAGGRLHVTEYVTANPGKGFGVSPKPAQDRLLASSISESQFLGWPGNESNIPAYEYRYTG